MNNTMGVQSKNRSFESRFSLKRMFKSLDNFQDVLVFGCGIALVFKMCMVLVDTFMGLSAGADIKQVTAQSLFLLILVELFRLVAVYLKHHRIYVGVAVELAVVSALREVIVEGIIHMSAMHIFAICAFLASMGALMFISYKVEDLPKEH